MSYSRILVLDGKPVLRIVDNGMLVDYPLDAKSLFALMKEGMAALLTMAQSGTLVGLIQEENPDA